jgi:hypothetical protein
VLIINSDYTYHGQCAANSKDPAAMTAPVPARPTTTAVQREERRLRIMAMVRAGQSYEAIGRQEQLTRERVRQIVAKSLDDKSGSTRPDHNRVQIARLEPALRLAAVGIANGNLSAIPHLLRVLERMDKYGAVVEGVENDWIVTHERLMKKMNSVFERADRDEEPQAAKDEGCAPMPVAAGPGSADAKNLESCDSGLQAP